jgi:anti-anti-sigma factor
MIITEKKIEDILLIAISGKIDIVSTKDLEIFLDQAIYKSSKIVFDMAETEYINSSGLRILLAAIKRFKQNNGEMRLASPRPLIKNIFDISGLSNIFSIYQTLQEAIDSFE